MQSVLKIKLSQRVINRQFMPELALSNNKTELWEDTGQ